MHRLFSIGIIVIFLSGLSSCSDKINKEDMYTFTGITVADYIRSQPELSYFAKLMDISHISPRSQSSTSSLLGTYGNFMVFVPTNEAIKTYLDAYYGTDNYLLDTLPESLARKIVNICIIDRGTKVALPTTRISKGYMVEATLSGLHLFFDFGDYGDGTTILVNDEGRVIKENIPTNNGFVNVIDHVIQQRYSTVTGLIRLTDNLKIFSRLLDITSWGDSMVEYDSDRWNRENPDSRFKKLTNYTVFAETDDIFKADWKVPEPEFDSEGNMTNWNDILTIIKKQCAAIYPEARDTDPTSMDNAVNQFVSYHLLPFLERYENWAQMIGEYGYNRYLYEKGMIPYPPYQNGQPPSHAVYYYQTMGKPNRLMEITYLPQSDREGLYINRHSLYDTSYGGDWQEIACMREGTQILPTNENRKQYALNGIYYPINHVLAYDRDVPEKVLNKRLRYHPYMALPEVITTTNAYHTEWVHFLQGFCDNMKGKGEFIQMGHKADMYQFYRNAYLQSDVYDDFTFKLLPVPFAGEWEVRLSSLAGIWRIYMGNSYYGDKQDLGIKDYLTAERWTPEWERNRVAELRTYTYRPDTVLAMEHDKECRQHDIMKLPYGYGMLNTIADGTFFYYAMRGRDFPENYKEDKSGMIYRDLPYRLKIYRGYMTPDKEYWLRFVCMVPPKYYNKTGCLNMIELVPKSVYDNPDKPEDWW